MKRIQFLMLLAAGLLVASFAPRALADGTNEVTLTGMMVCAKCKLHISTTCQNVLQVDQNGATVNYFLTQNQVSTDFHPNICGTDGEKATVTGTVEEKDGKEVITPSKIEAAK